MYGMENMEVILENLENLSLAVLKNMKKKIMEVVLENLENLLLAVLENMKKKKIIR